jgi:hypothetical protein
MWTFSHHFQSFWHMGISFFNFHFHPFPENNLHSCLFLSEMRNFLSPSLFIACDIFAISLWPFYPFFNSLSSIFNSHFFCCCAGFVTSMVAANKLIACVVQISQSSSIQMMIVHHMQKNKIYLQKGKFLLFFCKKHGHDFRNM